MKYFGFILIVASSTVSFSQIRCVQSITLPTDSKPLVVIDDKALPTLVKSKNDSTKLVDPLTEIDTNDIERIDVLKNVDATSVYGELGKNGVIVITTRSYSQKSKKE